MTWKFPLFLLIHVFYALKFRLNFFHSENSQGEKINDLVIISFFFCFPENSPVSILLYVMLITSLVCSGLGPFLGTRLVWVYFTMTFLSV